MKFSPFRVKISEGDTLVPFLRGKWVKHLAHTQGTFRQRIGRVGQCILTQMTSKLRSGRVQNEYYWLEKQGTLKQILSVLMDP
jgi:hypothetical protein